MRFDSTVVLYEYGENVAVGHTPAAQLKIVIRQEAFSCAERLFRAGAVFRKGNLWPTAGIS